MPFENENDHHRCIGWYRVIGCEAGVSKRAPRNGASAVEIGRWFVMYPAMTNHLVSFNGILRV